jgi:hypothetical protein
MTCPQCHCYCPDDARECPCGHRFPADEKAEPSPFVRRRKGVLAFIGRATGTQRQALRLVFLLLLLLWALALYFDDRLPPREAILPPLLQEPVQEGGNLPAPFQVVVKETAYVVTPLFRYELSGLVVSQHRSDSLLDVSHRRWRDFLNIKDLCLVWGRNIESGVYRQIRFWNRDFTCLCRFPDEDVARRFSGRQLSNNHLLCADRQLRRRILGVRPGDQVRLKGYLASYAQPANQFSRGTSTVRDDEGDGACETVYVTEFQVLKRANPGWRLLKPLALLGAAAALAALLLL